MRLLLLPGMDGTGELFAPLVAALPTRVAAQVVCYRDDGPSTYEDLLPVVRAALPTEPFVLVAESFSGPLAIMSAAEHPVGLRGIVLCASFIRCPVRWAPKMLRHVVSGFAFRFFPSFARDHALLGREGTVELRELLANAHAAVSAASLAARARSILTVDAAAQLRECTVPILYIRGSHDGVVTRRSLQEIQVVVPAIHVVTVEAPHLVLQVQPAACAEAIMDFVETALGC